MDKKIVITAMVLLVATPILIGYAMAFEEVTRTEWSASETKNMTDLLYNDATYSAVALDSYYLNADALYVGTYGYLYPNYVSVGSTPTSMPYTVTTAVSGTTYTLSDYYGISIVPSEGQTYSVTIVKNGTSYTKDVYSLEYAATNGYVDGFEESSGVESYKITNPTSVQVNSTPAIRLVPKIANVSTYANMAAGWTVPQDSEDAEEEFDYRDVVNYSPAAGNGRMQDVILSINLGGFVGTTYYGIYYVDENGNSLGYNIIDIASTVTYDNGTATGHTLTVTYGTQGSETLYMKLENFIPSADDNWYQLRATPGYTSLSYIGKLPSAFGAATAYDSVSWDNETVYPDYSIKQIRVPAFNSTITYRGDYARCQGFSYPVMTDMTYSPSSFSGNSSEVRINNISKIGTQLTWAGETFTVTDGNAIYVDGHKILLTKTDLRLRTIYEDSRWTNYVNGYEVSTTAAAPTVTLNGTWDCTVQSTKLESSTETSTEWIAGEFAWNGVDESFALVGLMTCVAVFIGLGIYGRRSGAKVGTLMIICGCAAFVFLAMM